MKDLDLKKVTNNFRVHYLKWPSSNHNISMRYFFTFQTNKELEGCFVLKNHETKEYIIVSEEQANFIIQSFCEHQLQEVSGYLKNSGIYIKNTMFNGQLVQTQEKNHKNIKLEVFKKVTLDL
jgi:hypothetical protein